MSHPSDGGTRLADQRIFTVELTGGLANQLFQWSAGWILSREFDAALQLDTRLVDRPDGRGFQLGALIPSADLIRPSAREAAFWVRAHKRMPRKIVGALKRVRRLSMRAGAIEARSFAEARERAARASELRLSGLFQEVGHIAPARPEFLSYVRLPQPQRELGGYAAVHIRRGDYASNPKYAKLFGVCSESYYRSGIGRLPGHLPVYIATDDRDWAQRFAASFDDRDVRLAPEGTHFDDLGLLAGARALVLSNSTFSWWGAFLSEADPVVVPTPWFSDASRDRGLVLDGWLEVPRE